MVYRLWFTREGSKVRSLVRPPEPSIKSDAFCARGKSHAKIVAAKYRAAKPQRWPRARPGRKPSSPSRKQRHPFPACPPSNHANGPSQPPGDCLCRLSLRQRLKVQTRSTNRGGGWRVPHIRLGNGSKYGNAKPLAFVPEPSDHAKTRPKPHQEPK